MDWLVINPKYLDYLREKEKRIPMTEYGSDKFKPFFGSLFETDNFIYVTQVSSAKDRHLTMKENLDFIKLYHPKNPERLLSVINLNYMFPVPKTETRLINNYKSLDSLRTFKNENDRSKYINLLKIEIKQINNKNISSQAKELYERKALYPNSSIATRCLNYKELEGRAKEWNKVIEQSIHEAAATKENDRRIKNRIFEEEMEL